MVVAASACRATTRSRSAAREPPHRPGRLRGPRPGHRRRRLRQRRRQLVGVHRQLGRSSTAPSVSATLNGAGSTFAAPIYQQVGADLKDKGLTINYQGVGSGAGVSQFAAGTVDFAGSDPALADEDRATIKKGEAVQIPFALGAITASYNLSGVKSGLKLDGETLANIYLGKIKTWDDPAIKAAEPGRGPAVDQDHGRPPLRLVGHDQGLHAVPGQLLAGVEERPGRRQGRSSGRRAPAPRATTASPPRSSRPTARSATSSRPTRCRTASPSPTSRTRPASSSRRRSSRPRPRPRASTSPADLGVSTIDAPGRPAYPIVSQTFIDRLQGPVQGRPRRGQGQGPEVVLQLPPQRRPGHDQEAVLRADPRQPDDQGPGRRRRACTCNGAAIS